MSGSRCSNLVLSATDCSSHLALVGVDNVVENDWLKEGGRLRRRPTSVERCFDSRYNVHRSQHHIEQVENDRLTLSQKNRQFTARPKTYNIKQTSQRWWLNDKRKDHRYFLIIVRIYTVSRNKKKEVTWCWHFGKCGPVSKFFHQLIRENILYAHTPRRPSQLRYVAMWKLKLKNVTDFVSILKNCWHVPEDTLSTWLNI